MKEGIAGHSCIASGAHSDCRYCHVPLRLFRVECVRKIQVRQPRAQVLFKLGSKLVHRHGLHLYMYIT